MLLRIGIAAMFMLTSSAGLPGRASFLGGSISADPCSANQLKSSTVSSTFEIQLAGQSSPQFSAITVITVPSSWQSARALTADPFTDTFRNAIGCFLPTNQTEYRPSPPTVSIAKGNVIVNDDVELSLDPLTTNDSHIGLWAFHEDNRNVTLSLVPPPDPARARWTVTVDTGGAVPHSWSLPPTGYGNDESSLSWHSISLSDAENLTVTLAWPTRLSFYHRLSSWPGKLLPETGWNLGIALFFALALFLLRDIRKHARKETPGWFFSDVSRVSILGLVSVLIGIVDQYEADQPTFGWFDQPINNIFYGGNGFSEGDAFANSEFIALVVFAAVLFYFAWRRRRRDQRLLLFVGLLTATAGLVQLEPRIWGGMPWPILDYGQAAPVSFATFMSLMTPQLITCFLLFSAVIGYFLRLWPVDIRNESRLENGPPRIRHALRWHFVALVLAVAVIGMVVYSSRQNWDTGSVLGNDAQKGPVNWLMGDLLGDFHGLIQDLPIFMFWPVVASLFGGLWFRSRLDNGVFFVDRRLTIKLLGLLYAGLFVGIWGEDFIFDVPIAFVAAYILFPRVTVSSRLENFEREMRFQGMPEPPFGQRLSFSQPALLRAEEKRKRLKAQLAVMDRGDHTSVEQEDYERRRQEIETEIESTAKRWNSNNQHPSPEPRRRRLFGKLRKNSINDSNIVILAPESIDPESIDPGQIALAVGRESTWWDNGWLCVRTGALLAAAPSAYYLYQAWNSGQLWPLNVGVGLITSLQNAASIPLGWLTLCFVYGCMLPYLKGSSAPVRGAILGLVALISFALDAVPTYTLRGPHYSTFLIDGIIAVVFTAALAVIMDARVLRRRGVNINYLIDIYRLSTLRVSLTYASTILIIIIGVWQQAHVNNQVSQERAQISTSVVNTLRNQLTQPAGR